MEQNSFDKITEWAIVIFLSIFGGAARASLAPPKHKSLGAFVASMVVAAFSGVMAYQLLTAQGCSSEINAAGAGIAGLLGDDLLYAVLSLGKRLREDPTRLLSLFRGRGNK